jgi:hypothetical protein
MNLVIRKVSFRGFGTCRFAYTANFATGFKNWLMLGNDHAAQPNYSTKGKHGPEIADIFQQTTGLESAFEFAPGKKGKAELFMDERRLLIF